jgi:abhydrolase domain-containing protein 14
MTEKRTQRRIVVLVFAFGLCLMGFEMSRATEDEPVVRTLELQGGKLHTLVAGPADGFPVLLLHGRRFHSGTWLETGTYKALASQGYHVVGLDLPGYGRSEKSEVPWDRFLAALIRELGMGKPVIVAPSMSGGFAFALLIKHPDLASGFVGVAPAWAEDHESEIQNIKVPTLLLWGENDTITPLSLGEQLKSKIEGSRMVVLEGAGHPCYLDRPDEFHLALLEFLETIRSSNNK